MVGGYSLQTSETTAFGDQDSKSSSGSGARGALINFATGHGNQLKADQSASGTLPTWVWIAAAVAGVLVFAILIWKRKGAH